MLIQTVQDTVSSVRTLESEGQIAQQGPVGVERFMLQQDKLYVVAAVVLLIWLGIAAYLIANDRRIARLERALDARDRAAPPGA